MSNGTTYVRRDIWSLAADNPIVIAYGDAVAAMQRRPASDPRSWTYQAAIHGTSDRPAPPLANECRHQSWYFLPWHRMFLYFFERIVRAEVQAAGGPADWALPFWDYDREGTRTLPPAFRSPTRPDGSPNPLHVPGRRPGLNAGTRALPASVTSAAFALSRPQFTGTDQFGGGAASPGGQFMGRTGRLEQTPHNDIHVQIAGLMGNPATAGRDPVFWLHHANVDRLWWVWDDASRANPTDAGYADQEFSFFDENGARQSLRCSAVSDTVASLHYTYQRRIRFPVLELPPHILELFRRRPPWPPWIREIPLPVQPPPPPPPRDEGDVVGGADEPLRLVGSAAQARVRIDARAQSDAAGDGGRQAIVLELEDISAERNPGTVYGVYVNLPEEPSPDELRAHHVGNLALFGIERTLTPAGDEHAHGGMQVAMDVTDLVRRLERRGQWNADDVRVSLRPIPLDVVAGASGEADADAVEDDLRHEDVPITIGRISIRRR